MDKRIPAAKFFNASSGRYEWITPDEYRPEDHKDLITCSKEDCDGAIKYVSAYSRDGSNTDVDHYFSHNHHGEAHDPSCEFNPDLLLRNIQTMEEALRVDKSILFNINFPTNFSKEAAEIKDALDARQRMEQIGGSFRSDWVENVHHATFGGRTIDKLRAHMNGFKEASGNVFGRMDASRMMFSHLHGAIPFSAFYVQDNVSPSAVTSRQGLATSEIVKDLYESFLSDTGSWKRPTYWRDAPAFKHGVKIPYTQGGRIPTAKEHDSQTTLDGHEYGVKNVLIIKRENEDLRAKVAAMRLAGTKEITFVATPFISRENFEKISQGVQGATINLNWALESDRQIAHE